MIKIENLTNRPVLLRLNNGKTLHLEPLWVSPEISETHVTNNNKIEKLKNRKIITLHQAKMTSKKGAAKTETLVKQGLSMAEGEGTKKTENRK
jgi:hypothetical protein